ncbi:MAG TPA: bifunctional phosphopantothenoylcysteine decarboxylase/phosphopantothenate--cysteine ligase CoaBC [Nitrososphaeraceae archaeon]|jgi:phosphopantothenoylcysteine decarboxylase/phosphopantothenate--cysteine ligase|nr:bifunctional phosphopantothenoylcysteine decarboxylase/phosphopantothenate--cysteine ligase CoaBC [Nitrososphaeraceae archaeon]
MNSNLHSSKDIVGTWGNFLKYKKIVLCVCGSVAAYKAIDFARLLMRHGANVFPVMSHSATLLLHPNYLQWATGNDVVTKLTANMEHIKLADYNKSDLIILYPCTANTIGKFANGIDDTPITSILSVGFGSKIPIFIAPAMHEAMYDNQLVIDNILKLKKHGINFLEPNVSEGKAKVIQPDKALKSVLEFFTKIDQKSNVLSNKNILITSGGTMEYIDPIRVVTNLSSGKMGYAIVKESLEQGAKVTHIVGNSSASSSAGYSFNSDNLITIRINTSDEMYAKVICEITSKKFDIVIFAAAVTDFKPSQIYDKKIPSQVSDSINLELIPTKKIINEIKLIDKDLFLVGFKAYYDVSDTFLIKKAKKKLKECNADIIVANDVGRKNTKIGSDYNEVFIVTKKDDDDAENSDKQVVHLPVQSKESIAKKLFEIIIDELK